MATVTAGVMSRELAVDDTAVGFGRVGTYLLTISPFVNLKRWLLAQFICWGSMFQLAIVVGVVMALTS
jgi:hypothetical protein